MHLLNVSFMFGQFKLNVLQNSFKFIDISRGLLAFKFDSLTEHNFIDEVSNLSFFKNFIPNSALVIFPIEPKLKHPEW